MVEIEAIAEGKTEGLHLGSASLPSGLSEEDIEFFDFDEYDDEDREQLESEAIDQATAAATLPELEREIEMLRGLVVLAAEVRRAGTRSI